ncbi:Nucleotidyltransferase (NT) domain-containing protein [Romboutsia ilealis]|uniref:Nucleotidyltransferase (NT) domain-containing protein n=1 Tax=Romboutsia ilealis TaxID=1115758 RepID=A0A1V1I309_9FIRM|nr:polynucleotide adenylyltransferase [Romboutsia ilealis]CED94509.1 Nucleotidyltransferase (NT) domain-containing protein [Romboutsia ilealis]
MEIFIPKDVSFLIDMIYENGYEAFMVGGCVRDSVLNLTPNDYDITTNAKPKEIMNIFKDYKIIDTGIKHGTVSIILNNNIYEITTYRIEGEYENNRRPKTVEFTSSIEEDLRRRDFTINAMAYNKQFGIIDKFNGLEDLQNRIIKTVGNPDERFKEDGLRMIRAIRFSSKLGFNIDENTLNGIYKNSYIIKNISTERINDEFTKILLSDNPQNIILLYKTNIFKYLGIHCNLNRDYYKELEKYINILSYCDNNLLDKLIILDYLISNEILKCIDKCEKYKYYCENIKKVNIINNLRYSNKVINYCNDIMEYMIKDIDKIDKIVIKRYLNNIGYEKLNKVFKLKLIYNVFFNNKDNVEFFKRCIKQLDEIENSKECYEIKSLEIDGKILKDLGYKGKEIGEKLSFLLDQVIKDPLLNKKDILINLLKL